MCRWWVRFGQGCICHIIGLRSEITALDVKCTAKAVIWESLLPGIKGLGVNPSCRKDGREVSKDVNSSQEEEKNESWQGARSTEVMRFSLVCWMLLVKNLKAGRATVLGAQWCADDKAAMLPRPEREPSQSLLVRISAYSLDIRDYKELWLSSDWRW